MNRFSIRKITSMILIAAMIILTLGGCGAKDSGKGLPDKDSNKYFHFTVVDKEGNESNFDLRSEKETVGEALIDEKLIEGTEGEYGLYVTKVNGIEAIYEDDGTYWSFYINGEYANTGVDATKIEDGATYMFKVEGN